MQFEEVLTSSENTDVSSCFHTLFVNDLHLVVLIVFFVEKKPNVDQYILC